MLPAFPFDNQLPTAPPSASSAEDEELAMAINASLQSAAHQRPPNANTYIGSGADASASTSTSTISSTHVEPYNKVAAASTSSPSQVSETNHGVASVVQTTPENPSSISVPSAPPIAVADIGDGPIVYPSIDTSPIDLSSPNVDVIAGLADKGKGDEATSSCTICLDAPLEGACIPCGHMVGCMSCLNEIKAKKWGCPVCRSKIDQVVRIYAV